MSNPTHKISLNILIIGTGLHVCGRGTDSYGTILPAIYEWRKQRQIGEVYIAGAHLEGIRAIKKKVKELNRLFGCEIRPHYFPENATYDSTAYKDAIFHIPKPACAIVVVPDALHRKIAGDAINNGLHTLVVKPLAPTVKDVIGLIKLQKRYKVYCTVEFHKRLDRANLKLRDVIKSGIIGTPLYFLVEYSQRKSIPTERFKSWVENTNVFQYLGVHYVDIIYWVTEAIPRRVMAIGQKNYLFSKGINTYDSIQTVIEWEMLSGSVFSSIISTNWVDPENTSAMSDQKIKVIGTQGRYEADQKSRGLYLVVDGKGIEEPNPDFCSMYGFVNGNISFRGYGVENIAQFLEDVTLLESGYLSVESMEGKRPTFRESLVSTAVIEAANRSLNKNGRWIGIRFKGHRSVEFK